MLIRDLPADFRALELAAHYAPIAQHMADQTFLEYVAGKKLAEYENILGQVETGIVESAVGLLIEHGETDDDRVTVVVLKTIMTFRARLAQLMANGMEGRA